MASAVGSGYQGFQMGKEPSSHTNTNFMRRRTDYFFLALIAGTLALWGNRLAPNTSPSDADSIFALINVLHFSSRLPAFMIYLLIAPLTMATLTSGMWFIMKTVRPETPTTHLAAQLRSVSVNMVLLGGIQVALDYLATLSFTKQYVDQDFPASLVSLVTVRDCMLWMLGFELAWYTQHRAMHDNKFLWRIGHAYHHSWKKPEHMIGITNFAFDHIVEVFVTMSSSAFPTFIFPIDFRVAKIIGFSYMIIAVLVHWDFFPYRYHLNHHYLVTKNYGSHWPIFDILFGTYQWAPFAPSGSAYVPGIGIIRHPEKLRGNDTQPWKANADDNVGMKTMQ